MTWSEFVQKVSIKRPGPSQKKSIVPFYFRAPQPIFGLYHMTWSEYLEKVSIKQPVFFSNVQTRLFNRDQKLALAALK